jgi:outer membrane receptor for ferrienterochelin and colicins
MRTPALRLLLSSLALAMMTAQAPSPPDDELADMSLEELLDQQVVTASNRAERHLVAPATVIVLTGQEIRERGYNDLSHILDDLPGMDVVRPYGDTWLKNYWRGYRNTIGEPFLLLVDGVVMNHLYFNTADLIATMPLANIERVEVVYGPASSVYGANAFMGVINIITLRAPARGSAGSASIAAGSFDRRVADVAYAFGTSAMTFRIAARFDNGEVDPSAANEYEYTDPKYYADRRLWGGFIDNRSIAGSFRSPHRHRALDVRAAAGGLELGLQYFVLDNGYGVEYAADRAQNDAIWKRPELGAWGRLERKLSDSVSSRTLVRYRRSDVSSDSFFVAANDAPSEPGGRTIDFSYWQSLNSSWSLLQDFEWTVSPRLSVSSGFKYEQKDLQKAYDLSYGPSLVPGDVDAARYPYPDPPREGRIANNRIRTEDQGVYAQAWYALTSNHRLNVGLRWDDNSQYGAATTLRAGYVATIDRWTFKALYGEAFQEPVPRLLYGGWTGSGSDPSLVPEESATWEASAGFSQRDFSALASVYRIDNEKTIVNTSGGAQNTGAREVSGYDLHVQHVLKPSPSTQLKSWIYFSHLLSASEESAGLDEEIGDLAEHKLIFGTTWRWRRNYSATLRGRYIGERDTVATNPVRSVDAHTVADASFNIDRIGSSGIGVQLAIQNLTDNRYFHPGIRDANAGTTPGHFDPNGNWIGSAGYFNSLLPQPGRSILVGLRIPFGD